MKSDIWTLIRFVKSLYPITYFCISCLSEQDAACVSSGSRSSCFLKFKLHQFESFVCQLQLRNFQNIGVLQSDHFDVLAFLGIEFFIACNWVEDFRYHNLLPRISIQSEGQAEVFGHGCIKRYAWPRRRSMYQQVVAIRIKRLRGYLWWLQLGKLGVFSEVIWLESIHSLCLWEKPLFLWSLFKTSAVDEKPNMIWIWTRFGQLLNHSFTTESFIVLRFLVPFINEKSSLSAFLVVQGMTAHHMDNERPLLLVWF